MSHDVEIYKIESLSTWVHWSIHYATFNMLESIECSCDVEKLIKIINLYKYTN